jgi:hypothetical protein
MSSDESWPSATTARIDFAKAAHANLQGMVRVADAKATAVIATEALVVALLRATSSRPPPGESGRHRVRLDGPAHCALAPLAAVLCALAILVPRRGCRARSPTAHGGRLSGSMISPGFRKDR